MYYFLTLVRNTTCYISSDLNDTELENIFLNNHRICNGFSFVHLCYPLTFRQFSWQQIWYNDMIEIAHAFSCVIGPRKELHLFQWISEVFMPDFTIMYQCFFLGCILYKIKNRDSPPYASWFSFHVCKIKMNIFFV